MSGTGTSQEQAYLTVSQVSKYFGDFKALSDVTFDISEGEFVCFLGPSGCGKTTLLRCIAGLETQSEGTIHMAGADISWLPPSQRDFGIVFQSYALFPNLSVADNVGFGLVNAGAPSTEIAARVGELLKLVGLAEHTSKYPVQLSGGEQQRVALARALATSPGLLLLDEPLSALDAKVRAHLRREIRNIQDRLGVTTIMVTHDQEEAQTMADRIFVMNAGRIEQIGTPSEIYDYPATPFVADFIGVMNFVPVVVSENSQVAHGRVMLRCETNGHATGAELNCAIRPEDILIAEQSSADSNELRAEVVEIEHLGSFKRLFLAIDGFDRTEFKVDLNKNRKIQAGEMVSVHIPPSAIRLYGREA